MTIRVHSIIKDKDLKNFKAVLTTIGKEKRKLHMDAVQLDSHGGVLSAEMAIVQPIAQRSASGVSLRKS